MALANRAGCVDPCVFLQDCLCSAERRCSLQTITDSTGARIPGRGVVVNVETSFRSETKTSKAVYVPYLLEAADRGGCRRFGVPSATASTADRRDASVDGIVLEVERPGTGVVTRSPLLSTETATAGAIMGTQPSWLSRSRKSGPTSCCCTSRKPRAAAIT
jgi:hypothetical protein